jgi:hypothetical protein
MKMDQLPAVRYDLIRLAGGMDQVTPTLSLKPGIVRRAANFECSVTGGYTRIAGYERFDGRPNPSDARYLLLSGTFIGAVALGATVTGGTSGATGKVIALPEGQLVLTRQTGIFAPGEYLTASSVIVVTGIEIVGVEADGLTDATYKSLAAEDYRADIGAVPGSGPIRGVAFYDDDVYAWRDNSAGTALVAYKSSGSGWTALSLGIELEFDDGTTEILEGTTVVGGSSGATGIVRRVVVSGGAWGGTPRASGRLIFTSVTGAFQDNEHINVGGTKFALVNGTQSQMSWASGGRVQFVVANFGGGQTNKRLYFCDGVNRAFEWDGTYFVPINTSMSPDVPTRIQVHKQHLFLAFGHSLQFSAIGDPYIWDPIFGAGEIAMNDVITQLLPLPGDQSSGALAVYTKTDTSVLYGSSSENFALSSFNVGTGGLAHTGQNLDQSYILSERGVMGLGTTLNFGNFATASLTMNLRPFIQVRRNLASASVVNREKGQYRVFFSDGYGLYLTIANGQYMGAMPVQFPDSVLCCTEGATVDGNEISFFGSSNGFVYRLDAGTSFDGDNIPSNITLVYNSTNSPRILKRYRRASVEMTGDSYADFGFGYDLGYRTPELEQPSDDVYSNDLRSAFWDSFTWDNFIFDGRDISPSEIEVTGTAENMAIRLSSVSNLLKPFTVNSIIVHYTMRRGLR